MCVAESSAMSSQILYDLCEVQSGFHGSLSEDEGREMTVKVENSIGTVNLTITLDEFEDGMTTYQLYC